MTELAVTFLRLSYLLVLWLFVLAGLAVLRRDTYGLTVTRRFGGRRQRSSRRVAVAAPPELVRPSAAQAALAVRPPVSTTVPTRLVVANGSLRGTSLPLSGHSIVIGRSSTANLVLDDEFASGRHAQLVPGADGWRLEDLGSTNGTFFGDQPITGSLSVRAGQQFRIGQTRFDLVR